MANYATLKAAIQQVIKTNGNNEITGALLQQSLLAMINSLGGDYLFVGVATQSTNPGTPDQNVFYIAGPGTYPNFNNATINDGAIGVMKYNGSWTIETLLVGKNYDAQISQLEAEVDKLSTSDSPVISQSLDYNIRADGYFASSTSYKHGIIYVRQGEKYFLKSNSSTDGNARYAFATSTACSQNGAIPLVSGTTVYSLNAGEEKLITIAQDCYLIYNVTGNYETIAYRYDNDVKKQFRSLLIDSTQQGALVNRNDIPIAFEYGGIGAPSGTISYNFIRVRTSLTPVMNLNGYNVCEFTLPAGVIINEFNFESGDYCVAGFKDGVFVKWPDYVISGSSVSFYCDGTFDTFSVAFKKSSNAEISVAELDSFTGVVKYEESKKYLVTDTVDIFCRGAIGTEYGRIMNSLTSSNIGKRGYTPKYISVVGGTPFSITPETDREFAVAQYDASKNTISISGFSANISITLAKNTAFVRILYKKSDNSVFDCEKATARVSLYSRTPRIHYSSCPLGEGELVTSGTWTTGRYNVQDWMTCPNPKTDDTTSSIQDNGTTLYQNWGLLLLPSTYKDDGKPTPLIVFCHGYSGHYNGSSTVIASTSYLNTDYFLKEGYAVLDFDGNLLASDKPHAASLMGVCAYIHGIKWVQERFNVSKSINLAGHSMGGMMASLLCTMGQSLDICSCVLFAPATSIYMLMELHPEHRSAMAQYYGFEGTAPTWGNSQTLTSAEKDYINANIDKVFARSIHNYSDAKLTDIVTFGNEYLSDPTQTETDYYSGKSRYVHHIPVKVFQGADDASCREKWTTLFVNMCKNGGMNIEYRVFAGVTHTGDTGITKVGDNTVTTIYGEQVSNVPTTLYEMIRFFRRYLPNE